ncbi:MAG TPA: PKD domain-containing protein, partial [Thermoplasmatales archaeon]|nr:PKD domain-containing protein [Thermoplasmatales archaeon]
PKHAYTKAGRYTATLTVTDSIGNTASDTAEVVITEELTAEANGPYYGEENKEIQFHGDAGGGKPPYTWEWDFGDGKKSNDRNPKHAYSRAGVYQAKLTVKDSEGNTATDTAQVTVYKKLEADADGPHGGLVNQGIQFHGSATGGVPPYTWWWTFGDGAFDIIQNPIHSYSSPGVYTATLTVTDSIGNMDSDSTLVYIFTGDTQPPFIRITRPNNSLYINDKEIIPLRSDRAVIIGDITIRANASDNIGIARVEFYLDNQLKHINFTPPYYWLCNVTGIGKHTIKAVAYDFAGHVAMDQKEVWIINPRFLF